MLLLLEHCINHPARLPPGEAETLTGQLDGWRLADDYLERSFEFGSYQDTIAFVNALAWIAQRENHHPELTVSFGECRVRWCTHSAGGLTRNDFICAAKVDALFLA
ncbi:4a-hydroxytetrahydrobiopterin dehydratase [Chitinilyticum piscinae]|uniref:Putative pterin-4-alpha-carbinolamine dehydratase n=1 Tax=Chitinilyticum piscinae TaxID=2866724 RepID=A0A8J7FNH6_9NEIS|nr:4a-hydroxytetrahydrobiopterin dehydratase [Chitinilyticum piscinae]MBE9610680.1 4a-hydroxytetrahydrobiopterin dehydratase [Chitinilyticum piscinae]